MPGTLDPVVAAGKWKSAMASAGPAITAGVNAVTVSPTAQAADAVDRQVAGVQAAAASGRTAARLRAVSLQSWKDSMNTKTPQRLASGAAAGAPKYQSFATKFFPIMAQASQQVKSMPKTGNIEDSLNRVRVVITAAKQFKQTNV